ncbi:MAG TPA: hypothetical protein VFA98_03635, partial [Thermoanaerobaculia bacterium]|nr:hypothetical protein [Thermoanaerobaculia bacterium]
MRRCVGLLFLLAAASVSAATLPSLFYKAKEQFRLANYSASLETLDQLQAEADRPGNEAYRAQLAPALAFYRGACYAALNRTDEARASFETYLAYTPNPSLDPSLYPHRVIALLEETRKTSGQKKTDAASPANASSPASPADTGSFAAAYRAFKPAQDQKSDGADENWANGPVRYLLTADQRDEYNRLSTLAERTTFVEVFWKAHDP